MKDKERRTRGLIVGMLLVVTFGYNVLAELLWMKTHGSVEVATKKIERRWNITIKEPVLLYPITTDTAEKNWYRLGFLVQSKSPVGLTVTLQSFAGSEQGVMHIDLQSQDEEKYYEQVFLLSLEDISVVKFSLSNSNVKGPDDVIGVGISSVLLSKLLPEGRLVEERLSPTYVGTFITHTQTILLEKQGYGWDSVFETEFTASDDFVEGIDVSNFLGQSESPGGWLEIRRADYVSADAGKMLRREFVDFQELRKLRSLYHSGVVPFPVWTIRGDRYILSFRVVDSDRYSRWMRLLNIRNFYPSNQKKTVVLITGQRPAEEIGILRGARIEDLGGDWQYSYHSDGSIYDYLNLWRTEGQVRFDEKTRQVVGNQRSGTSFTYKFSVGGPFRTFLFEAEQRESRESEILLEYSLDGETWKAAQFIGDGARGWFRFVLSGQSDHDTVYVRVKYQGVNRKSGVFGLKNVVVTAQLKSKH